MGATPAFVVPPYELRSPWELLFYAALGILAALVAAVGGRMPAARWKALERAFLALPADPQGAAALQGIRMVRFAPVDAAELAAARRLAGPAR